MKKFVILITLIILSSVVYALNEDWQWVKQAGGTGGDEGNGIATDSSGNSYVTGSFSGTATFGSTSLTSSGSSDIFIAKLDSAGNYLWAKQAGVTILNYSQGIATDSSGNSYVTGYFRGTATFGTTSLTSNGSSYNDIFVAKLDTDGNYLWAKKAGGTSDDYGYGISTDSSSNCYVTGGFAGTATFGTTSLIGSGYTDIFIAKLDTNGNYLWAKKAGGTRSDNGYGVATDSSSNCYVTGSFMGTATFGTTTLVNSSTSYADIFIAKLDMSGNYLWAKKASGINWDSGNSIAIDSSGNSYVTGEFNGSATFGTSTLISNGYYDIFIAKLDTNGNFLWAKQAGGTTADGGNGIATDDSGKSYVTGHFYDFATFGSTSLTSNGGNDIFVAMVAPDGPTLHLNESSLDFGTTYFGYYSTYNFYLRNIGAETLRVDSLAVRSTDSPFEVLGLTTPFNITSGDSTAIQIRFTPLVMGAVSDSLIIYNNSINLPRVAIRLNGTGESVPPMPPENVAIVMNGNDAVISWDAVTETEMHTPIVPDYYLVSFNGSSNPDGLFYFLASVNGLTYTHFTVGLHSPYMFYRVRAYKYYGRGNCDITSLGLVPGMREDEVLGILEVRR